MYVHVLITFTTEWCNCGHT